MPEPSPDPRKDEWNEARQTMVQRQLRLRGIEDERVLDAMSRIPREEFVAPIQKQHAYNDCALPIECSQTISQPYTVAFMCEAARLTGEENVLEIGTGSGYGAAVLSLLAREVHTVERIPELAAQAQERFTRLGYSNIHVHTADGTLGVPDAGPFDAIIVTAGAASLPAPYIEQLNEGGRIIIPVGPEQRSQTMHRYTKDQGQLIQEDLGSFAFVPLIGKFGWSE